MSNLSRKRIGIDIKNYHNSNLSECGIICKFNENNLYNAKALIIGPDDTPYEGGFYFFDINFTEKYPHSPPSVKLQTLNKYARFNPNLYTNGKVCLSILGTWSGPGWTSCLSLNTVLLSIQTLLNENPIQNEPGFENEKGESSRKYNNILTFQNLEMTVADILESQPMGFEEFKQDVERYFVENYQKYSNIIEKNIHKDKQLIKLRMYNLYQQINYYSVKKRLEKYYQKLLPIYKTSNETVNENISEIVNETKDNKGVNQHSNPGLIGKNTKRVPDEKANDYEVGYVLKSKNDNRNYIVKSITTKKGLTYKKWILNKN